MNATINAFPPLHAFRSSRSWFLAIIVLLHAGFFWVLSNGLSIGDIVVLKPSPPVVFLPGQKKVIPPPQPVTRDPVTSSYIPRMGTPVVPDEDYEGIEQVTHEQVPVPTPDEGPGSSDPVIVEPIPDPRFGLTEPLYPSSEIRMGHTGTVILAVHVLPNGRIGEVRVERSSGYVRLDESAVREARRWRMLPGTRDGVPASMWKRIPITFRLQDR